MSSIKLINQTTGTTSIVLWMILCGVLIFSITGCIEIKNDATAMIPGPYRGVFLLGKNPYQYYDEDSPARQKTTFVGISKTEIPFNFEIKYNDDEEPVMIIHNGEHALKISNISYGTDRSTSHDTMRIEFPEYNAVIIADYAEDAMQGYYIDYDAPDVLIPFNAFHGETHRFSKLPDKPTINIDGRWKVTIFKNDSTSYPAIGEFQQEKDGHLTGTFATEAGDYGYLEGLVEGDEMWLSTFDGSRMYLFNGKLIGPDTLAGIFKSEKSFVRNWIAVRDNDYSLRPADEITHATSGNSPIDFCFLTTEGDSLCLSNEKFAGRVKILQIMGTWCPNCKDETRFLQEYFKNHPESKVQILGLAIERYKDVGSALRGLRYYKDKMDIEYPVMLAGSLHNPMKNLPFIKQIRAYPTMIFLDKNNVIHSIHTGFYGPATAEYAALKKTFHQEITELTNTPE